MSKRRIRNESLDNLYRVSGAKDASIVGQMDITMADAVQDDVKNEQHLEEVKSELQKSAETVTPDKPQEDETKVKNAFTAKLILDENLKDFKLTEDSDDDEDGKRGRVNDPDGTDPFLDYDMFDFIYCLCTGCYPKPLNPLKGTSKKLSTFMYIGSDTYKNADKKDDVADGNAQISVNGDTIVLYANLTDKDKAAQERGEDAIPSKFDGIRAVCDMYKFKYTAPKRKANIESHWDYSMSITVPCEQGYPMMVEDYFESIGLTMEDVMEPNFCEGYRKAQERERKEAQAYLNDVQVDKMVKSAITAAAQDNSEPLKTHLDKLFADLKNAGLTFKRMKVKKDFMDAFDDGDEEE